MDEEAGNTTEVSTARRVECYFSPFKITPGLEKFICALAAGTFLGIGLRSALKHTRELKSEGYSQVKIAGGVNFASRALAVSTVITVSGYALFVIGISALLRVDSPRQFGEKMKKIFGDRFRLKKTQSVQNFREALQEAEK